MILSFQVHGAVKRDEGSGLYVGRCFELDLCSQGRTQDEAHAALQDAIDLYLKHCIERGILFDILQRQGIGTEATPADDVATDMESVAGALDVDVKVPLSLVADASKRGIIGRGSDSWRR